MRESNKKPRKKHLISCLILLLAVAALTSLTGAWLNRLVGDQEAAGFVMTNSGTIMGNRYQITTSFLNAKGLWQEISKDYEVLSDVWADEDHTASLVPSERTEFKTVVKSTVPVEQSVSLFLQGICVDENLKDVVVIGASEPEVLLYACNDTGCFSASGTNLIADHLPICVNESLAGYDTLEIYWYVNTSSEATGGTFPALADSANPLVPITKVIDNETYYYYVNAYDAHNNPTEAYRCDEYGVVEGGNHLYQDDFPGETYTNKTTAESLFGNLSQYLQISGIYVAVG